MLTDPLAPSPAPGPGKRAIPMHYEYLEVVGVLGASGDGQGSILGIPDAIARKALPEVRLAELSIGSVIGAGSGFIQVRLSGRRKSGRSIGWRGWPRQAARRGWLRNRDHLWSG